MYEDNGIVTKFHIETRCYQKMLMLTLTQFIQDVMPFLTCCKFLFHECSATLKAD
jgi:hypothetical protein